MACAAYRLAPRSRAALAATGSRAHTLDGKPKAATYASIEKALRGFMKDYPTLDTVGRMATLSSFLHANFPRWCFVGFYTVSREGEQLSVGPYQGEVLGCGIISFGKGVCGTAAATRTTQIVRDVHAIENYIACDDETQAEIVVPVFGTHYHNEREEAAAEGSAPRAAKLIGVLDVDADEVGAFDEEDRDALERLCAMLFAPAPAGTPAP